MSAFSLLGTVLSHGYLVCGFLPVRIAFPATLLGRSVQLEDHILMTSFFDYVSNCDSYVLKSAYQEVRSGAQTFSDKLQSKLISIFSHFFVDKFQHLLIFLAYR